MEERRLLLAVALSLLVLTLYQFFFAAPPAPRPAVAPSPVATKAAPVPAEAAELPAESVPPPDKGSAPVVADERERRVEVTGPDVVAAFTNRGARLVSWRLARFKDVRGRPEEMVQSVLGGARPLDLETGTADVDARLRAALFRPSADALALSASGYQTLRFDYSDGDIVAAKELRFPPEGYLVSVSASVTRAGRPLPVRVVWGPGIGNPTASEKEVQGYQAPQGVALSGVGVERVPAEKIGAGRQLSGVRWVGVESHYFAALLVPPDVGAPAELRAQPLPPGEDGKPHVGPLALVGLGSPTAPVLLYVGPKDYHILARAGHELSQVVPVGDWIGPIVVPLMGVLRWVHGHVGNYGWSIVLLTLLINLVMAPLRHYSISNGLKMAKLAPEMRVIQERYRKVPALDPKRQEMQKEMAALYARHGMSMGTQMMVGCLPLLLTMPFLIAIYRVLQVSIELRGAPFLWIPDLSQRDPLFLTPVLMGASMFIMQRMTPTSMDPAQQRMMMMMPLVLMVMFFAAPAGLNLYWLASNVCSIIQQGVTLTIIRGHDSKERRAA